MVRIGFFQIVAVLALLAGGKAILYDTLDPDFYVFRIQEKVIVTWMSHFLSSSFSPPVR